MTGPSSLLLALVLSVLVLSVRCQPPAPEGMPALPGMGSSDDDSYTVYQMDPSTSSMLGYEGYEGYEGYGSFDVLAVGDEFGGVGQLVSLGAKKGTFHMPQPLAMVEAAPRYETLPTETMKTRYLKPVTRTTSATHTHKHIAADCTAAYSVQSTFERSPSRTPLTRCGVCWRSGACAVQLRRSGHPPAQDHHTARAAAATGRAAHHPHSAHQAAHPPHCHQQIRHSAAPHVRPRLQHHSQHHDPRAHTHRSTAGNCLGGPLTVPLPRLLVSLSSTQTQIIPELHQQASDARQTLNNTRRTHT